MLLLPFNALSFVLISTAKPDCVVHWGWPLDRQSCKILYVKRQSTYIDLKPRLETDYALGLEDTLLPIDPF